MADDQGRLVGMLSARDVRFVRNPDLFVHDVMTPRQKLITAPADISIEEAQDIFDRYGLTYHSAPLYKQVASAWHKVIRLSLPNGWLAETTPKNAPAQVIKLVRMTTGGKKVRRELSKAAA